MGKPIERQVASGACTKCGFVGHLPFQCRNTMPIEIGGILRDPLKTEKASSESDFETPLQREGNPWSINVLYCVYSLTSDRKIREREAKRLKKQLKKMAKKQKKEAKKKETKKRRRNSSSSSSSSDTTSKNQKKHKKNRESKKKRHRERHSSKSSSSSD